MENNSIKPAFPCTDGKSYANDGLTKREYFAALAMQGICANVRFMSATDTAKLATEIADKLLEQLNQE